MNRVCRMALRKTSESLDKNTKSNGRLSKKLMHIATIMTQNAPISSKSNTKTVARLPEIVMRVAL